MGEGHGAGGGVGVLAGGFGVVLSRLEVGEPTAEGLQGHILHGADIGRARGAALGGAIDKIAEAAGIALCLHAVPTVGADHQAAEGVCEIALGGLGALFVGFHHALDALKQITVDDGIVQAVHKDFTIIERARFFALAVHDPVLRGPMVPADQAGVYRIGEHVPDGGGNPRAAAVRWKAHLIQPIRDQVGADGLAVHAVGIPGVYRAHDVGLLGDDLQRPALAPLQLHAPVAVHVPGAEVTAIEGRLIAPANQALFDDVVFPPAEKQAHFKKFRVAVVGGIIDLIRGDDQHAGI